MFLSLSDAIMRLPPAVMIVGSASGIRPNKNGLPGPLARVEKKSQVRHESRNMDRDARRSSVGLHRDAVQCLAPWYLEIARMKRLV
jgi:hypothetical protein